MGVFSLEALGVGGEVIGAARKGEEISDGEPGWNSYPPPAILGFGGATEVEKSERLLGAGANPLRSSMDAVVDDWVMAPGGGMTGGGGVDDDLLVVPIGWEATAAVISERLLEAVGNPSGSSMDGALNDWLMAPGAGSSPDGGVNDGWLVAPPAGGRGC